MIQIDSLILNCDTIDILYELKNQLHANGIQLLKDIKDSGDNIMITCPFHKDGQERRPSAGVKKDDGVFHCFTCDTVKSLSEFISNCFGYDDYGVFGTQWLAKNFSTVSVEERKGIQLEFSRGNTYADSHVSTSVVEFVSEEELSKYRYYHPYMYQRKLTDEIIEIFDIGYDKDTDCITFPVRDVDGNTLFVARRSVKTKYFNYPSGAEKPLYGLYEILKTAKEFPKEVIVCESMLDALFFWTIHKYAIALNGLGSSQQYKQLCTLPCRKLILATDSDEAGMTARLRIRNHVKNKIITEYIFPLNRKDANECTVDELKNLREVF